MRFETVSQAPSKAGQWRRALDRSMVLPFEAASVDTARKQLQAALAAAPVDRVSRENAVVVFHELAMNAVDHGSAPHGTFELGWCLQDDTLVLSVVDHGTAGDVVVRPLSLDQPRGRGLLMVDAFSRHWQVERDERTRVTAWVDLTIV